MTDIHTHILPGIDDGSDSPETSYEMLRRSYHNGVGRVAATPHYYSNESVEDFLRRRAQAYRRLAEITSFPIKLGAEVYYTPNLSSSPELARLAMGRSGCLLLELPYAKISGGVLRDVEVMRKCSGLNIIIAHVERYMPFNDRELAGKLLDIGCELQINAESLDSPEVRHMLKRDMISYIASDMHNLDSRPPCLKDIPKELSDNSDALFDEM